MEANGRINVSKEEMGAMVGLPRDVKFISLNETQHGYSLEVQTNGKLDANQFLASLLQRTRLKMLTPVTPVQEGPKA